MLPIKYAAFLDEVTFVLPMVEALSATRRYTDTPECDIMTCLFRLWHSDAPRCEK